MSDILTLINIFIFDARRLFFLIPLYNVFNNIITSCVPGWKSVDGVSYNIFILVLGFILPLAILVSTSLAKYNHLTKVRHYKNMFEAHHTLILGCKEN